MKGVLNELLGGLFSLLKLAEGKRSKRPLTREEVAAAEASDRSIERHRELETYRRSAPMNWHFAHHERMLALPAAQENEVARAMVSQSVEVAKMWRLGYPGEDLPSHRGFERLAIDAEKAGLLDESVAWCERAQREGWAGDWAKRIERCKAKAAKVSKPKD